jgi:hypothetical protein
MNEGPDKLIQFLLNVLANLIALALYGTVTYLIWKAIW